VGKSSLLNRLIGRERALVSPEPGTTRDFIEERIIVGPHCLRLIDTAGFNLSPAPLERMGIEKTLERAEEADLFLVVLDATHPVLPAFPAALSSRINRTAAIVVMNKSDLAPGANAPLSFPDAPRVAVSALTGQGLEELQALVVGVADQFRSDTGDLIAISARHAQALKQAHACLEDARAKLASDEPIELVASDLRGVLAAFGEITGRIDNEQMLDALFATFCIGK
jgi:tRNA modification GTPase